MGSDLNIKFYDELSEDYHLIFDDWESAVTGQAKTLDNIIRHFTKTEPVTLLDCACGIGTQAIGLANLGYQVQATDLSPKAVARARVEADRLNVALSFGVADFKTLNTDVEGTFDVVIACDNALPHLLDKADLLLAAANILSKMKPGGVFLASIRDYDKVLEQKPLSTQPTIKETGDQRAISFQIWDWTEDNVYTVNHFMLKGKDENFHTSLRTTKYKAYQRSEMTAIFEKAGYTGIKWLMPDESGYYQPVLVARKA